MSLASNLRARAPRLSALIGAVALLAAPAAQAQSAWTQTQFSIFTACDGFGMPSKHGDGMTAYAMVWGIFNPPGYGTTAKTTSADGNAGIAACTAALADDHVRPEYWLRRVNLLKARALHRLEQGDFAGALKDLQEARAAVQAPDDVLYRRSLGLDLDFVQAYALRRSGDAAGQALAREAWMARPWTRLTGYAALIALGPTADSPDNLVVLRGLARLQPSLMNELFVSAFEAGRWQEIIDLYPQQYTPRTRRSAGYGGYYIDIDYIDRVEAEVFWAQRAGGYAFALAALGHPAEARAAMQQARDRVARAATNPEAPAELPPPPANPRSFRAKTPNEDDKKRYAEAKAKYDAVVAENVRIARRAGDALDRWTKVLDRMLRMQEAPVHELLAGLQADPLPKGPLGVAIADALIRRAPAAEQARLTDLRGRLVTPAKPLEELSVTTFFKTLPDAEIPDRLTPYRKHSNNIFGSENGFSVRPLKPAEEAGFAEDGVFLVSFRGVEAPAAVAEEMALLQAAEFVRSKGLRGFIILHRADIQHTVSTTQYGTVLRSDPAGYETQLYILPVDPAALPAKYRATPWRIVDADAAWDALSPVYVRAEPEKPAKGRK